MMSTDFQPVSVGPCIDMIIETNIQALKMGFKEPVDLAVEKDFFFKFLTELVDYHPVGKKLRCYVSAPVWGSFVGTHQGTFPMSNHAQMIDLDEETIANGIKVGTPYGYSTVKLKPHDLADIFLKFVKYTGWTP